MNVCENDQISEPGAEEEEEDEKIKNVRRIGDEIEVEYVRKVRYKESGQASKSSSTSNEDGDGTANGSSGDNDAREEDIGDATEDDLEADEEEKDENGDEN